MQWRRLAIIAAVGGLLVGGRGHVGRFLRRVDQRAGIFAPRAAGLYNAVAPTLLRPLYRQAADEVVASLGPVAAPQVSAVLEIGSGPGELAVELARRLPGGNVLGIDLAPAMIERATELARSEGLEGRVRFQLADAASLPLPDGSFDAVVSTLSLHHWSDPTAVFLEMGRVLRPGGVTLIYDMRPLAYTRDELELFLAGGPFESSDIEREPVGTVLLGPLFVRIALARPTGT
jgi:ubiquinone/menaquinone biosynthesis C-methylase UbiE